jgi:ketosteroid isomerase-like protein
MSMMSSVCAFAFLFSARAPTASDEARIRAATREFVLAFNSRDVDRLLLFYADDYLDLNLPEPRQSKSERWRYLKEILDRGDTTVDVSPEEILVNGDYAYVRGTIHLNRAGSTKELRYMELLRKFPQGWKAIWGIDAEIYPASRD